MPTHSPGNQKKKKKKKQQRPRKRRKRKKKRRNELDMGIFDKNLSNVQEREDKEKKKREKKEEMNWTWAFLTKKICSLSSFNFSIQFFFFFFHFREKKLFDRLGEKTPGPHYLFSFFLTQPNILKKVFLPIFSLKIFIYPISPSNKHILKDFLPFDQRVERGTIHIKTKSSIKVTLVTISL